MLYTYKNGQGSIILRYPLGDITSGVGGGLTGLGIASTGLAISTIADSESAATVYTAAGSTIETIATLGTFAAPTATKCRFKEVDSVNHPGLYEFQFADARFAVGGAKSLLVTVQATGAGAPNLQKTDFTVQLVSDDPYIAKPSNFASLSITAAGLVAITSNVKKNQALAAFNFTMTNSTTHNPQTGLAVTATRSLDGGAFAACANAVTELANGDYLLSLAATDLNANTVMLRFTAALADDLNILIITQP